MARLDMEELLQKIDEALEDFTTRLMYGHEGIAKIWEQKMHPGVFEFRMDNRRDLRKERKHMALLKMIGGLLTVLFWFFVVVGTLAIIGLTIYNPLIAAIVLICILAGVLNAAHRHRR